MTIIPIFRREMMAAARGGRLPWERASFAAMFLLAVGGSFWAWSYSAGWVLDSGTMARITNEALRWGIPLHATLLGTIVVWGAASIGKERERRTLDFVLATPLSSAEVVLGKLAACVAMTLSTLAVGAPFMILLHALGGVEWSWILVAEAALATTGLFLSAMAIWFSAESPDRRTGCGVFLLGMVAWFIGPFQIAILLPRWGIRLPESLAAANWWLGRSSPLSIALLLATGLRPGPQLAFEVGRMIVLQLAGTVLFATLAIVRLRPVHRTLGGVDRAAERRARRRQVWRFRSRPPVGDDPIFWRERYTSREGALLKAASYLIFGGLLLGLAIATFLFARPAFVELWHHGYASAAIAAPQAERNILVSLFMPRAGSAAPVDIARTEFNDFIRYASVTIILVMCFVIGGLASETLGRERLKETWTSLLATPLSSREILVAALRTAAWRSRWAYGAVLALWTLGLAAGAVHPLGFLLATLELIAMVGLTAVFGALGSIRADKVETAMTAGLQLVLLLIFTGLLPLLLPPGLNPVLLGAGSVPLMVWTSLMSYREVASALSAPLDPNFPWVGQMGGQMPLLVAVSWLVAIVAPALGTIAAWRYALTHFDRLVGRPHRAAAAPQLHAARTFPSEIFPAHAADPAR